MEKNLVYLDSAASAQKPEVVINSIKKFMKISMQMFIEEYIILVK